MKKEFQGWTELHYEERLEVGDVFVWVADHIGPSCFLNVHPDTTLSRVEAGTGVAGRQVYNFMFGGYWVAYRREKGPRRLPLNQYFSQPLPLP